MRFNAPSKTKGRDGAGTSGGKAGGKVLDMNANLQRGASEAYDKGAGKPGIQRQAGAGFAPDKTQGSAFQGRQGGEVVPIADLTGGGGSSSSSSSGSGSSESSTYQPDYSSGYQPNYSTGDNSGDGLIDWSTVGGGGGGGGSAGTSEPETGAGGGGALVPTGPLATAMAHAGKLYDLAKKIPWPVWVLIALGGLYLGHRYYKKRRKVT